MNRLAIVLVLALLAGSSLTAYASTWEVTSALDVGAGSLRLILEQMAAGDLVRFDASVFPPDEPNTILLESPLPGIAAANVTIDGSNAGVILDGSALDKGSAVLSIVSNGATIMGLHFINCPTAISLMDGAADTTIGGNPSVGEGPGGQAIVVQKSEIAVLITGTETRNNQVTGSFLGTAHTGRGNYANSVAVAIRDGSQGNQIGPGNTIAYSSGIDIEIVDGSNNIIGPDNRILQNFLPTIRVVGRSTGNVITRNSLRTTGRVRGYEAVTERACYLRDTCSYPGAIEIEPGSQGDISPPRITLVDTREGRVAGTACPNCVIEVFSGGTITPYTYEGSAQANADGQFTFDKGEPLNERSLMLTATDPERGTSAVDSPLCRDAVFPRSSTENEISVMTWNILAKPFGVYRDGAWHVEDMFDWRNLPPEEWEEVSPEWSDFIELIEYANADVLALQEVQRWIGEDHRMLRTVAERLGYPYFTLGTVHDEDGGPSAGILSRFEIVSYEQNGIGNGNMRAEILLPNGETLQVIDVHIQNCTGVDHLPQLLEWISPHRDVPAIVLGDFNANLVDPQIAECFCSMTESGWRLINENWSQRIPADSIWVSEVLAPFARGTSAVTSCASKAGYEISNHMPVMMLLSIPWEEAEE